MTNPRAVSSTIPGVQVSLGQAGLRAIETNADQAAGPKVSTGPDRSLVSRTSTRPGRFAATSTQEPVPLLRLDFRHCGSLVVIEQPQNNVSGLDYGERQRVDLFPR